MILIIFRLENIYIDCVYELNLYLYVYQSIDYAYHMSHNFSPAM